MARSTSRTRTARVTLAAFTLLLGLVAVPVEAQRHSSWGHRGYSHRSFSHRGFSHRNFSHRNYSHRGFNRGYNHSYRSYGHRGFRNYSSYRGSGFGSSLDRPRVYTREYVAPQRSFGSSSSRSRVLIVPSPTPLQADPQPRAEATVEADPWTLLRTGRSREALTGFTNQVIEDPDAALPKIGYSLASARLEDLQRSVWSMRRALQRDANALSYVTVGDDEVRQGVAELITAYEYADVSAADRDFMAAALHVLLTDYAAADAALARAEAAGDTQLSTVNLRNLITDLAR